MRAGGLALLLALALAAGCGGGEDEVRSPRPPAPAELTAEERRGFDRAVAEIQRHCRIWARFLTEGRTVPPGSARRAFEAVDALAELVRLKPRAPIGLSADVRLRAGDVAESVEGANCDPRLERHLDQQIAAAASVSPGA